MRTVFAAATVLASTVVGQALAENFSCSFGRGACLDYGDIVCTSFAKCVDRNAICFDSYTCDFKGFICKSKFDDVIDEYDALVVKFNDLLDDSNAIAARHRRVMNCITAASSLDEAHACAF